MKVYVKNMSWPVILYKPFTTFRKSYTTKYSSKSNNGEEAEVINKLVRNQGISITLSELDRLKEIPGVKYDLPLNSETVKSFNSLIGGPKTRLRRPGVYIFTHKKTGHKYVGSSNSLSRRIHQYFNGSYFNKHSGLLIPLIKCEGLQAFTLEVFVMPNDFISGFYFLFLEQYYLLQETFKLNTQRVVNFRVSQGKNIYLYGAYNNILYYISNSLV